MTAAEVENIARKTADKVVSRLPCNAHNEKIEEHETILKNGLKDKVDLIDKKIDEIIKTRLIAKEDLVKGRKSFWRAFAIGTIGPAIIFIFIFIITKAFA